MPTFPALTLNAGSPAATVQFYTPVKVNRITPTRLLFGFGNDVYESLNQGGTITSIDLGHVPPAPGVTVNDGTGHLALIYGGTTGGVMNADLIYAGSGATVYRRTAAPGTALAATGALLGQSASMILRSIRLTTHTYSRSTTLTFIKVSTAETPGPTSPAILRE